MKILFIGPLPYPVTGQSICFQKIADQYSEKERIVIDTSRYKAKVLATIYVYFKLIQALYSHSKSINCIYFTCSRSIPGFIKDFPVLLFGKLLNIRIINHLHGSDFDKFTKQFPFKKLLYWLYRDTESIVLLDAMKEQFSDYTNIKLWTVPNFYDKSFDSIDPLKNKKRGQILFLSNLMKSKGIIDFTKSADKILADNRFNIVIAGSFMKDKYMSEKDIKNLLSPEFERLSAKYGDRFTYIGYADLTKKIALFAKSDIFILPSYTEGFPISIIEAMRMGCVIITSNIDYLPKIIDSTNGAVIPLSDLNNICLYINGEFEDYEHMHKKQKHNILIAKNYYSELVYTTTLKNIISNKQQKDKQINTTYDNGKA